ncbi:MAG: YbgA family protein [Acidilobaceae archaeon]|nr:YbgA family protein [Acidilobaceae archaeon]
MTRYPLPRIALSSCLMSEGREKELMDKIATHVELVPLCPRLSLGIQQPRQSLLLLEQNGSRELLSLKGRVRVTRKELLPFALRSIAHLEVDGFLLRSESPFCGVLDAKVLDGELRVKGRDDGLFTQCIRRFHPLLPVESHKRLLDYETRRLFFARVFSLADLRETLKAAGERELAEFHRRHKYLLMLHSSQHLKLLGNVVANGKERPLEETKQIYRQIFMEALAKNPSRKSYVRVFLHVYNRMKRRLDERERELLKQQIHEYGEGRKGLRSLLLSFQELLRREGSSCALLQRFLQPYPPELEVIEPADA